MNDDLSRKNRKNELLLEKPIEEDRPTLEEADHQALINRIVYIMKLTYERLEIAHVIPDLLIGTGGILKEFVTEDEMNKLCQIYAKYFSENEPLDDDDASQPVSMSGYQLIAAVDLIQRNGAFVENLPRYVKCLPESSREFLKAFSDLKTLTEVRIGTSAKAEIQKEKVLHQISHENEKMEEKIQGMKSQLKERDISLQWKIAEKQVLVEKYRKNLATEKWNNQILVKKEVATANERMGLIYTRSEERQQSLRDEAEKTKLSYEKLLQQNIRSDKKLRGKKARILTQLKSWIKKYDTDIGERTREVNRLAEELAIKTAEHDEFMKLFEVQEAEYNKILAMREAEEKKAQQEKMLLFMMNRAAKIIQRVWREYIGMKKKKSKGKQKKGKKQ